MTIVFAQKALYLIFMKTLVCLVICKATFEAPFSVMAIGKLIWSVSLLHGKLIWSVSLLHGLIVFVM